MRTGAGGESTFLRFISNGESDFIDARERRDAEEGEGRERAEGGGEEGGGADDGRRSMPRARKESRRAQSRLVLRADAAPPRTH